LKYDNTLLYEKNVQKDRLLQDTDLQILSLKEQLAKEQNRFGLASQDQQRAQAQLEEASRAAEEARRRAMVLQDQLVLQAQDLDSAKKGQQQLGYECENLRRLLNSKQEQIDQLNRDVSLRAHREDQMDARIQELQEIVQETEGKNGRLVDLLNSNIYQKAEDYKQRVLNRLQNSSATPNKQDPLKTEPSRTELVRPEPQRTVQASPARLQRILRQEEEAKEREREDLKSLAQRGAYMRNRNADRDISPYHLINKTEQQRSTGKPSQSPSKYDISPRIIEESPSQNDVLLKMSSPLR